MNTNNKVKVHKRLTIAELRNCKGFENYSDEQAEDTIKTLETLSILFYELYMKEKRQRKNLKIQEPEALYLTTQVAGNKEFL
jgi:hypothetical protein